MASKSGGYSSNKGLKIALIVVSVLFVGAAVMAVIFMLKKPETPAPVTEYAKITLNAGSHGKINDKTSLDIYVPYGEKWGNVQNTYEPKIVEKDQDLYTFAHFEDDKGVEFTADSIIGKKTPSKLTAKYSEIQAKTFETDSWAIVAKEANKGTTSWAYGNVLGKTRKVELFDKTYTVKVIGVDDDSLDGGKKATLTFEFQDVITDGISYAKSDSESADNIEYETSNMRSYLNDIVYKALPEDLRKVIVQANKQTYKYEGSSTSSTKDYLFPLSLTEMGYDDPETTEGIQYDGYPIGTPAGRIKTFNDVPTAYWLRSPSVSHEGAAWGISEDGEFGHITSFTDLEPYDMLSDLGVSPAFCVGSHA